MNQIKELFQLTAPNDIKRLLEYIIKELEKLDRVEQNKLLAEIIKEAKDANSKLKEEYKVAEGFYYYPEKIAFLALIAEEIATDADIEQDMLKVLKINLNNYFKQFKKLEKDDWRFEPKKFEEIANTLEVECKYFSALRKNGIKLSILSIPSRHKRNKMELINYSNISNKYFSIRSYYSDEHPSKDTAEICLEQFGFLLKEILVGDSQKAPDGFLELFEEIDMPKINEESKELTALFASTFAHYIIEKMEIRITNHYGKGWKENLGQRDENFVEKMMNYFDNIFNELLKEEQEWEDNEKCPCR